MSEKTDMRDLLPLAARAETPRRVSRRNILLVAGLVAAFCALECLYAFRAEFDSDEPQHLHVAWGWAQGQIQYRDFFDNHPPVFHVMMSPLVGLLGDRADLICLMRLAMIPLLAGSLLCTYWMGRRLFSPQAGLGAVLLLVLLRASAAWNANFRADHLWTLFWMLALAVLVCRKPTAGARFLAGLLLGATLATSMKTSFLLVGLVGAWVAAFLLDRQGEPFHWRKWACDSLAMLAGFVIVPACVVLYFYAKDALGPFYYGTILHNINRGTRLDASASLVIATPALGAFLVAWAIRKKTPPGPARRAQFFIALLGGLLLVLISFFPLPNAQSYLPIYPVLAIAAAGGLLEVVPRFARGIQPLHVRLALAVLIATSIPSIVRALRFDRTAPMRAVWAGTLRLTDPNQTVMDPKGDLIFRPRGCYQVLEAMTLMRFKHGLMIDDIPRQLMANRTCVAYTMTDFGTLATVEFMRQNYIPIGPRAFLVAGQFLRRASAAPAAEPAAAANASAAPISFDIAIEANYVVVTPSGPAAGLLDGQSCSQSHFLAQGPHQYIPAPGETDLALIWAQAIQRGFPPAWSLPPKK